MAFDCNEPVANLFLLRESLYLVPCSSMSTPDSVLLSFMNCIANVDGLDGPVERSNLALREPAPGIKHKRTFIIIVYALHRKAGSENSNKDVVQRLMDDRKSQITA